jgi:predicted DNA-binding ribbon-helix-helix protein
MRNGLHKRSIDLAGHKTSVALEPEFWRALERLAAARGLSVRALIADIDGARPADRPLASACRVAALLAHSPPDKSEKPG